MARESSAAGLERALRRVPVLPDLLLVLGAFAAHWGALRSPVVRPLDLVRMFSGAGPADAWTKLASAEYFSTFHATEFRPVTTVFYRLGWLVFGSRIEGYHAAKLAVLAATGLLAFRLGERVLGSRAWGFAAAALFVAHPAHADGLRVLSFTADLFMTFFLASALLVHAEHREGALPTPAACAGLGLAFGLALLSKETALVFPALLWLFDRALPRSAVRTSWKPPALAVASAALAYAAAVLALGGPGYGGFALGGTSSPAALADRLAAYLSGLWGGVPASAAGRALGAAAVAFLVELERRRSPGRSALAAGWLVLTLAPLLQLVPFEAARYLEDAPTRSSWRLALPALGFSWLAASTLRSTLPNGASAAAAGLLFAGAAWADSRTFVQEREAHVSDILTGAFRRPGYLLAGSTFETAMLSLPQLRRLDPPLFGRLEKALAGPARPTIADLFRDDGIYGDAERTLRVLEALSHKGLSRFEDHLARAGGAGPFAERLAEAVRLKDAGVGAFRRGRSGEAAAFLERALEFDPDNLHALASLGAALESEGRVREARRLYERGRDLGPEDPALERLFAERAAALAARPR